MALSILLLLLLPQIEGQSTVQRTVVEGLSTNIEIPCSLDRHLHPLYWNITDKVYELFSVPAVFTARSPDAITMASISRRMDGWGLYCFAIDPTNENGVIAGVTTVLNVLHEIGSEDQSGLSNDLLLPSLHGRLSLNYQDLQYGQDTTTLGWLHFPDLISPCAASAYQVDAYSLNEISTESENSLTAFFTSQTAERHIDISSNLLRNSANYWRISALQNCAASAYFHDLFFNGTVLDFHTIGTSASFVIPEHLRNNRSVQLIWPKDSNTQCVCPPVEQLVSQCACNIDNLEGNIVTISDNRLSISNLTLDTDEEMTMYFVSSVSSGCRGTCNLRSIVGVYRIIRTQGYPQPPIITYFSNNSFCFTIPDNPISPEVYEITLTDSTGSLIRLSGVYSTSRCLIITSDLYPNVCGPFQLSVAAVNEVGREVTQLSSSNITEPTPCECYQQKRKYEVTVTPTSNAATFSLLCNDLVSSITLKLSQASNSTNIGVLSYTSCNSTMTAESLTPSTTYNVSTVLENGQSCSLSQFVTNGATATTNSRTIVISSVIVLLVLVLIVLATVCFVAVLLWRRKTHKIKLSHSETVEVFI